MISMMLVADSNKITVKKESIIYDRSESRMPAKRSMNFFIYLGVGSLAMSSAFIVAAHLFSKIVLV